MGWWFGVAMTQSRRREQQEEEGQTPQTERDSRPRSPPLSFAPQWHGFQPTTSFLESPFSPFSDGHSNPNFRSSVHRHSSWYSKSHTPLATQAVLRAVAEPTLERIGGHRDQFEPLPLQTPESFLYPETHLCVDRPVQAAVPFDSPPSFLCPPISIRG